MNNKDINLEIEKLKEQINILSEENNKLKEDIKYYIRREDELKSQLVTERCMKY